ADAAGLRQRDHRPSFLGGDHRRRQALPRDPHRAALRPRRPCRSRRRRTAREDRAARGGVPPVADPPLERGQAHRRARERPDAAPDHGIGLHVWRRVMTSEERREIFQTAYKKVMQTCAVVAEARPRSPEWAAAEAALRNAIWDFRSAAWNADPGDPD